MRLTTLGSAASYASAGQACAGHVLVHEGASLLLDCGNGVVANLAHVQDPARLDAVAITHAHPDHVVDLYALQALLRYAPGGPSPALDLWAPAGLLDRLSGLLSDRGAMELAEAFRVTDLGDGTEFHVGGMTVTSWRVDHTAGSFAFVVVADGARLVYTGDTAAGETLDRIAAGADVLLAEATLPDAYQDRAPHLTAAQAGAVAARAGVGTLVLTHIWPTSDRGAIVDEARTAFNGRVLVARELEEITVG